MFKVEDLKPGMLVKLVNGDYGLLVPAYRNNLCVLTRAVTGRMNISTFDLRFYPNVGLVGGYSIIAVYDLAPHNQFDIMVPGARKLLWEGHKKEMTIEEIEKALGYGVKIVKEH